MNVINKIMMIIGWVASVITIVSTLWYICNNIKKGKNISWKKIMKKGIKDLAKKVEKINPDCIITFSGRGSIVCGLVMAELENKYPVYMCILKSVYDDNFRNPPEWTSFNTRKWTIFVPNEILGLKDKKILVIDDLTDSGETIKKFMQHLKKHGLNEQKLFSMALIANREVLSTLHIPQEYWKKIQLSEYNLPWGKTEIR